MSTTVSMPSPGEVLSETPRSISARNKHPALKQMMELIKPLQNVIFRPIDKEIDLRAALAAFERFPTPHTKCLREGDHTVYLNDDLQIHRLDGPAVEYNNGTIQWAQNGVLHREDGPAHVGEFTGYYNRGLLHREDGPAASGSVEDLDYSYWFYNGYAHRDNGPALEFSDGTKAWFRHGELYRAGGPAIELSTGEKIWVDRGQIHREGGPAIESPNGDRYFRRGIEIPFEQWKSEARSLLKFSSGDEQIQRVHERAELIRKELGINQVAEDAESYCVEEEGKNRRWYKKGTSKLHRVTGPALEFANGKEVWYFEGKIHSLSGPAVKDAHGNLFYYKNGKLNGLEADTPAIITRSGSKIWCKDGRIHRDSGPAVILTEIGAATGLAIDSISTLSFNDNKLHNVTGPAVSWGSGIKDPVALEYLYKISYLSSNELHPKRNATEWWVNGKRVRNITNSNSKPIYTYSATQDGITCTAMGDAVIDGRISAAGFDGATISGGHIKIWSDSIAAILSNCTIKDCTIELIGTESILSGCNIENCSIYMQTPYHAYDSSARARARTTRIVGCLLDSDSEIFFDEPVPSADPPDFESDNSRSNYYSTVNALRSAKAWETSQAYRKQFIPEPNSSSDITESPYENDSRDDSEISSDYDEAQKILAQSAEGAETLSETIPVSGKTEYEKTLFEIGERFNNKVAQLSGNHIDDKLRSEAGQNLIKRFIAELGSAALKHETAGMQNIVVERDATNPVQINVSAEIQPVLPLNYTLETDSKSESSIPTWGGALTAVGVAGLIQWFLHSSKKQKERVQELEVVKEESELCLKR